MPARSIQGEVFEAARRLGHHWVGPEHGVIALAGGPAGDPARRALEAAGFDGAAFEARYVERVERGRADTGADDPERGEGLSPNPAWYRICGRAEGFAGALGTGTVRPADLLLALLWDTRDWLDTREFGVTREAILDALADAGVRLPDRPMPDLDREWVNPRRVDFPLRVMDRVVAALKERHPPGSGLHWAINHDTTEAGWAFAEEGIDLEGIVRDALDPTAGRDGA